MRVIRSKQIMQRLALRLKLKRRTVGFVPTMGFLHAGHLNLVKQAARETDTVIVSIFVNPTQFDPGEDFRRYPRNFRRDEKLLKSAGADIVFYPTAAMMYPKGYQTFVEVAELSNPLCGRFRPRHFRGVATVVTKLFNITQPDIAYFGLKDYQQAQVIKRMTADLDMPLRIRTLPTLREKDGLAMSSRNTYLTSQERRDAVVLYEALKLARKMVRSGVRDSRRIKQGMLGLIRSKKSIAGIDYVSIADPATLKEARKISGRALVALAARVGKTRLIDNIVCNPSLRGGRRPTKQS